MLLSCSASSNLLLYSNQIPIVQNRPKAYAKMPLRRMKNSGRKAERVKKQKRPKRQEVSASSPTAASHREELRAKAAKYYQGPKVRTINQIREGLKPDSGAQDSHFFATSNKTPKMAPQHATKTVVCHPASSFHLLCCLLRMLLRKAPQGAEAPCHSSER